MSWIDVSVIVIYLAGIMGLGMYGAKRVKDFASFSTAGRNLAWPIVFATLAASFIGGGFSMGNAEKNFLHGMSRTLALFAFSVQTILVGLFVAPRLQRFRDCHSVGDIMRRQYGAAAGVLTGVLSIVLCTGNLGAQVSATGKIFDELLGIAPHWGILIGCTIVVAYSTAGGMWSVVWTDVVQFIFLSVGIPLLLVLAAIKAGGVGAVMGSPEIAHTHFRLFGDEGVAALAALAVALLVGETLVPPYVQRALIARRPLDARLGAVVAGVFSLLFFAITGAIGVVGRVLYPDANATSILPRMVLNVLPAGLSGLVMVAILAIIMSSADSFLNAISVSMVRDFIQPVAGYKIKDRSALMLGRILTLVAGTASILLALAISSVIDILLWSYNFWAPTVVIPLVASLFVRKPKAWAALAAMICGGGVTALWAVASGLGLADGLGWPEALVQNFGLASGVAVNLVVYFVVHFALGTAEVGTKTPGH